MSQEFFKAVGAILGADAVDVRKRRERGTDPTGCRAATAFRPGSSFLVPPRRSKRLCGWLVSTA